MGVDSLHPSWLPKPVKGGTMPTSLPTWSPPHHTEGSNKPLLPWKRTTCSSHIQRKTLGNDKTMREHDRLWGVSVLAVFRQWSLLKGSTKRQTLKATARRKMATPRDGDGKVGRDSNGNALGTIAMASSRVSLVH